MSSSNAQWILAGIALVLIGVITMALIFFAVPKDNQQLVTFALGALSGALTAGGAAKVADKITNSSGPDATIQPDPTATPKLS